MLSSLRGHSQKLSFGLLPADSVTTCEICESPPVTMNPVTSPSLTALAPECTWSPLTTGAGTLCSTVQLARPLSKPPLLTASCGSEHDALRKWKQAEVPLLPPQELLAVTRQE